VIACLTSFWMACLAGGQITGNGLQVDVPLDWQALVCVLHVIGEALHLQPCDNCASRIPCFVLGKKHTKEVWGRATQASISASPTHTIISRH